MSWSTPSGTRAAAIRWTLGGEYRHFVNENFAEGTGVFNFPSVEAFLAGTANAFNTTLGERRSVIDQRAMALFVQDQITLGDSLTLELGLRYEWHVTPTERDNRFVVFDAASASLLRVGVDVNGIYQQNNRNLEPRLGVAWSLSPDGRTVVRAAYGRAADEPGTTAVRDTAGNPPFASPLTATGSIPLVSAVDTTGPAEPQPRHRRFPVPERVDAVVECERAAATRPRPGRDDRLFRLTRHEPSHLAQSQSAGCRRAAIPRRGGLQPDSSWHTARQHHPGGEQRVLELLTPCGRP